MIYLFAAILCSTSITLGFALAGKRGLDTLNVTMANYIVATLVCAFNLILAISGQNATITDIDPWGTTLPTILVGIFTGIIYLLSFVFLQRSVLTCGPSAASLFSRISMILPVLIAVFLFQEVAGWLRWVGVVTALVGLILYSYQDGIKIHPLLIGLFFCAGLADLANKLFTRYCVPEEKPLFMTLVFLTAGLICFGMIIHRRQKALHSNGEIPVIRFRGKEWLFGLGLGVVNMLSTSFSVSALQHLPATIVYPVLAVATILLTALAGRIFFGDRFSTRQKIAMLIVVAALVMLNI